MRETTKQNFSIFLITLLLGAIIYIFITYLKPALDDTKKINKEIAEIKKENEFLQEYQKKAEELVRNYSSLADQIGNIELAIPSHSQTAQILATLDNISRNNGIVLNFLSFDENVVENIGYVTIQTSFTSTYPNIKFWLKELEKELRLMDIEQISISAVESESQTGTAITKVTTTQTSSKITPSKTKSSSPAPTFLYVSVTLKAYFVK